MNQDIFFYALGFALLVGILSVYLKRSYRVKYDRKTLLATVFAILGSSSMFFLHGTSFSDLAYSEKIIFTIAIILLVNAGVQFIFWLIYTLIRHRDWVRMPRFFFDIISFFVILGVILYCVKTMFNQELTGLLVTSTVVSAVIGLALQDTLSNLFSGISLQIESPFNIEDWVNLGGFEGKVVSQNWRTVTLLTRENHRVSLTNRFVAEDKIVNFSRPTRRQIHNFYIVLDYAHPPNMVKSVLRDLLNEIDEIEIDENLGAFVLDYMDSGIKYCLRYWLTDYADILHIQDVVLSRLWYTLQRRKIKIPYPISEVQMQLTPTDEENKPEKNRKQIEDYLTRLDWLHHMDKENLQKLVTNSRIELYADDDIIVSEGEPGDSMFIILKGEVRILVRSDGPREIEVARKARGEFFGELSLLTGEPRTASVRAHNDCEVLVIDKKTFSTFIISDEKLLQQFVAGLEECKSGIAEAIEDHKNKHNVTQDSARMVIFNKIWSYLSAEA